SSGRQGLYARAPPRHAAAGRVEVPGPPDDRAASEKPGESQLFRAGADVPLHRQPDVLGCDDDGFRLGNTAARNTANAGETVGMKWHKSARNILLATAFASLGVSGCGSKSAANQVVVSVTGTVSVMVPTQTQTITATVTGATDVSATFDCSYTTTPNPTTTTPSPKPSTSAACTT